MENLISIENEQQLLGALLANNNLYPKISGIIRPEMFAAPEHSDIFSAATSAILDRRSATAVTLKPAFANDERLNAVGGADYIASLEANAVGLASVRDYADVIHDLWKRRCLVNIADDLKLKAQSFDHNKTADKIGADVSAKINATIAGRSTRYSASELIDQYINQENKYVTSTGFYRLDAAMSGGLYSGKFYSFAARMKAGKTALMSSIAYNAAKSGAKILYLALEMGGSEIMQRILARHIGCNANHLMKKEIDSDRVVRGRNDFENISLVFDNCPMATIEDICAAIIAAEGKFDGIIIDYIQLISGANKGEGEAQFHARVAQTIAATVKNCPSLWVLTAAQLNREGEVRGSDGLRMAADMLIKLETDDSEYGDKLAWMEVEATRYTAAVSIGNEAQPSLVLDRSIGPYYREI